MTSGGELDQTLRSIEERGWDLKFIDGRRFASFMRGLDGPGWEIEGMGEGGVCLVGSIP